MYDEDIMWEAEQEKKDELKRLLEENGVEEENY